MNFNAFGIFSKFSTLRATIIVLCAILEKGIDFQYRPHRNAHLPSKTVAKEKQIITTTVCQPATVHGHRLFIINRQYSGKLSEANKVRGCHPIDVCNVTLIHVGYLAFSKMCERTVDVRHRPIIDKSEIVLGIFSFVFIKSPITTS